MRRVYSNVHIALIGALLLAAAVFEVNAQNPGQTHPIGMPAVVTAQVWR